MSYTHLAKAAKPKQLIRLSCLVVYVKFHFAYTTTSQIGSQVLLASTTSTILPGWNSEIQ